MSDPIAKNPGRARRVWRRIVRTFIVLAILGVLAYQAVDYYAARSLRRQVADIRAKGQPVSFLDLADARPRVDAAHDAGRFYAAAMALVEPVDFDKEPPGYEEALDKGDLTGPTLAEARRRVDADRLALDMVDRGAPLDGCNYELGLRFGVGEVLERLNTARATLNAVSLRSRVLAAEGHRDDAIRSVVAGLRFTRVLDREPALIVYLVKVACVSRSCMDVAEILSRGPVSEAVLADLDRELARTEPSFDVGRMFLAERVFYLELTRAALGGSDAPAGGPRKLQPSRPQTAMPEAQMYPGGMPMRLMVARSLPTYGRVVAAATAHGFPAVLDDLKRIGAESHGPLDMFAAIIAPSFARSGISAGNGLALLRCARAAVAVERYRMARNGALPATLGDAGAADLRDPFTGHPLLYARPATGYRVYSTGEDRKDDAGAGANTTRGPDIGIAITR